MGTPLLLVGERAARSIVLSESPAKAPEWRNRLTVVRKKSDGSLSEHDGLRSGRQQMLVDFGIKALGSEDLDDILYEACVLVSKGAGEPLAKIVEDRGDSDRLHIRAERGFDLEEADRWVGRGTASSAGHALLTGTPTVSNHADADERFSRASFIEAHGIRSVANVLIPDILAGPGVWWGVLEVDSCERGAFSDGDVDFLHLYASLVAAAIGRLGARETIRKAYADKERLLQELQHRIKNNLATVTGLVRLQARQASSKDAKKHLEAVGRRVETLRLVHERLYSRHSTEAIELRDYLEELVRNLVAFHGAEAAKVAVVARVDAVMIDTDTAIPIGLIVNEFITNAIKYAFADGTGEIVCELRATEGEARLVLADDGVGLPEGFASSGGTGTTIVGGLARQLGGSAEWTSEAGEGTRLEVRFSIV